MVYRCCTYSDSNIGRISFPRKFYDSYPQPTLVYHTGSGNIDAPPGQVYFTGIRRQKGQSLNVRLPVI